MHLRKIELSDLELLRTWRNSYNIRRFCRQVGLISKLDQDTWFKRQNDDPKIQMFVMDDNGPLGVCGLTDIDLINKRAEFSLYIGPEHQKKGYGRKALEQLFRFGFYELNLQLIWGETFDNNTAYKLFEKIGMTKEGTRRNFYYKEGMFLGAHLNSITKGEWVLCNIQL